MIRELVTRPISALVALVELPGTVQRSLKQANELMESSRRQLEAMQRQTDEALHQAERMNQMLSRVVRLTEPLEYAQRGSEYVGGRLKRAIFGEEEAPERLERVVDDAERAAAYAEEAATEAEDAADHAEDEAGNAAEHADEADGGWYPKGSAESEDEIRIVPHRPPPGEDQPATPGEPESER